MGASADDIALFSDGGNKASADDIAMFSGPSADAGPEARRAIFGAPKFPEPKSDEELGIDSGPIGDYGKRDIRRTLQGRNDSITTPEAREKRDERAHREDVIANDPLAGMIAQGLPAAGATAFLAPFTGPLVAGAAGGAAANPDAPLTGAALGAIPGLPGAARAADRAIGEAAFNHATTEGFGGGPGPIAKAAGKLTGMAVGSTHGPLGLLVGHDLGGRAANLFSKAGDAATSVLARRYLDQEIAGATVPDLAQLPSTSAQVLPRPAPRATGAGPAPGPGISLAPLEHQGPALPTEVPPGALPSPPAGDFDALPTAARGHATVGGETVARPRPRLRITDENGRDLVGPSLRDDVARDAKRFRDQGPDVDEPAAEPIESQLERSVRMLSELKSAARAGKVSPTQIQDALKAGMSPQAVAKTVGREAFERATQ